MGALPVETTPSEETHRSTISSAELSRTGKMLRFFKRLGPWSIVQGGGAAALALVTRVDANATWDVFGRVTVQQDNALLVSGLGLTVIALLGNGYRTRTNKELESAASAARREADSEIEGARSEQARVGEQLTKVRGDMRSLSEQMLTSLLTRVFDTYDGTASVSAVRATLFRSHGSIGHRAMLRASSDPTFAVLTRRRIPVTQGLLGEAWKQGNATRNLPAHRSDPEGWEAAQDETGLRPAVSRALRMKSSSYALVRLTGPDNKPYGMIVLESEEPEDEVLTTLEAVLDETMRRMLCQVLEILEGATAVPVDLDAEAKEGGRT